MATSVKLLECIGSKKLDQISYFTFSDRLTPMNCKIWQFRHLTGICPVLKQDEGPLKFGTAWQNCGRKKNIMQNRTDDKRTIA